MSIMDVPISRCEAMRTMVVTDQTQAQCAREHECPPGMACPLCGCFSGDDWRDVVVAREPPAQS